MTELEKKLLLSQEEYDYLMEHFGYDSSLSDKSIIKQINYYFDTDDLSMNHQNITCRIRLKDGKYKGIMKQHTSNSDQSTEKEVEVRNGIYDNTFIDMGLTFQGRLITDRCVILKDSHCEVVLDKNEYLEHTDYELEIEYDYHYEKKAQALLQIFLDILTRHKYFVTYEECHLNAQNGSSKSNRFFARKSIVENAIPPKKIYINERPPHETETTDYTPEPDSDFIDDEPCMFDYVDPDDYMHDYYWSMLPKGTECISCIHFNGASCRSPHNSCEYEGYEKTKEF